MDHLKAAAASPSSSMGDCSSPSSGNEEDDLRRGPWTVEEDLTLMNYIARHGEGRWNSLSTSAGLKRTGKSCRLRWLNYLRPDVRRGNITLQEQLLILELHSQWGNKWSKIAQYLPGRTDNEIKNYWRTRVQKQAKQLNCDVNSKQFKDTMRYLWMPRLLERIQSTAAATGSPDTVTTPSSATASINSSYHSDPQNHQNINIDVANKMDLPLQPYMVDFSNHGNIQVNQTGFTPETSSAAGSTASFGGTQVVSPVSDLNDFYNYAAINQDYNQSNNFSGYGDYLTRSDGYFNQGLDCQMMDQNNLWMDDGNVSSCLWNMDDSW